MWRRVYLTKSWNIIPKLWTKLLDFLGLCRCVTYNAITPRKSNFLGSGNHMLKSLNNSCSIHQTLKKSNCQEGIYLTQPGVNKSTPNNCWIRISLSLFRGEVHQTLQINSNNFHLLITINLWCQVWDDASDHLTVQSVDVEAPNVNDFSHDDIVHQAWAA